MGRTMAEIWVAVRPDLSKTEDELNAGMSKVDGSKAGAKVGDSFSSGFGRSVKKLAGLAAGALASRALAEGLKGSVTAASDLNETTSKTQQIFGKSATAIQAFASKAPTALGQTKQAALDANATFGLFGKTAGLSGQKLVGFTTDLTTLAGDLASFNNTTPEQAIEALGAALRGESEPIRSYGVLLDDATLKAEAMRLGLVKTAKDGAKVEAANIRQQLAWKKLTTAIKEHGKGSTEAKAAEAAFLTAQGALKKATEGTVAPLTQQQKVLAAQSAIMKQTSAAQGDFARTSGGLANQQRIAAAQTDRLKVAVGNALLPVVLSGATALNSKLLPPLIDLAEKHGPKLAAELTNISAKAGPFVTDFLEKAGGLFSELSTGTNEASPALTSLADSGAKLAPVVQELLDKVPSLTDVLSVSATAIGFLADNTDTLQKLMPLLVAGVVAYKVAQLAANVAQVLSVPMKVTEVVVNRQLVKSNQALIASRAGVVAGTVAETAATAANTGAKNAGILATARLRAAAIAQAATSKVIAAATIAWTAAQWLLNIALTANPIGLVIVAGVALAALFVLLWKRSETFRTVATGAFNAFKTVAVTVIRAVWDLISGFFGNLLAGASKAFGWVPGIGPKLRTAATEFGKFRDSVNTKLAGITDQQIDFSIKYTSTGVNLSTPSRVGGSADGGKMRGPGTDTSDSIMRRVSNNEWIIKARSSKKYGDYAMSSVNAGTATIIPNAMRGFAAGGRPGLSTRLIADSSGLANSVKAVVVSAATAAAKALAKAGGGLAGTMAFGRSQAGKPYVWGGAGPNGYDCSGFVSALINFARGRNPYRRLGSTGTMPWSDFGSGSGRFAVGWFKGNPGHTAATINGTNFESRGGRGVVVGPGARGARDRLFSNYATVKGFAEGGRPGLGDLPFDLIDPRGKAFRGKGFLSQIGIDNFDIGRGKRWESGTLGVNLSGKTERVFADGDTMTVRLSDEDRSLLRALRDIPLLLDGRRVDEQFTRRALNGGYA